MTGPLGDGGERADLLAAFVERARAEIPFYGNRLAGHDPAAFRELPTSSKAAFAGWGTRPLTRPGERPARYCATSGTTGTRLLVGFSAHDWDRLGDQLGRRARTVGLGPSDVLANTHGYGMWIGGPSLDLFARGAGATLVPLGPGQTGQLLSWIEELGVTAMSATPSYLRYLAERIRTDGIDPSGWELRVGLVGGEAATVELRRQVIAAFGGGLRWQELYGASEVGGPTLGWSPPDDPLCGELVVDTDEFVVELLRPDRDEPVAPGELGEVTVTTPYREVDPLVRYRLGDLARAVAPRDGTMTIGAVAGRVDDALKVRGALVHPSAIEALVVAHCPDGAEWRIVVDRRPGELDTLTVVVEHGEADAGGLADLLHDRLAVRAVVDVVAIGSLPRFEGKASRVDDRR